MKTKEQKRREAIERLERTFKQLRQRSGYDHVSDEDLTTLVAKRHEEAKRLRTEFKVK